MTKIRYRILETCVFCFIFLLFILPVLLPSGQKNSAYSTGTLSWIQLELAVLSSILFFLHEKYSGKRISEENVLQNENPPHEIKKITFAMNSGTCLLCFGILMVTEAALQAAGKLFNLSPVPFELDKSAAGVLFAVINFTAAVLCEEFVFRYYFPVFFEKLFSVFIKNQKAVFIVQLILSALLFGICHKNSGILAVINGFCAHFCLYFCFKKTGKIYANCAVHLFYNLVIYSGLYFL